MNTPAAQDGQQSALLRSLGARFDHVAHAVPSIEAVLPLYMDILGGVPISGGINPWGGHLAIQLEFSNGARFELLEPAQPHSPAVSRFLTDNPRGGLHHITFKIDDIHEAIERVESAGYAVTGTYLESDGWKETFIHPRGTQGVLIQLAQAAPGVPGPLNAPLPELLAQAKLGRSGQTE